MKTVCVECEREMQMLKAGVYVFEMAKAVDCNTYTGGIYKIWNSDSMTCLTCHKTIVTGFSRSPIMEHFQDGFKEKVQQLLEASKDGKTVIVYDHEYNGEGRMTEELK